MSDKRFKELRLAYHMASGCIMPDGWGKRFLAAIDAVDPMRQPLTDEVVAQAVTIWGKYANQYRQSAIRKAIEAADAARLNPKIDPLDAVDKVHPMRQPVTDDVAESVASMPFVKARGITINDIRKIIEAADAARMRPKRALDAAWEALPIDICRQIGAGALQEQRDRITAAQGQLV